MSIKDELSAFAKVAREEAVVFAEKFRQAAIGGAHSIHDQVREAADELLPQSASVVTDRVKTALQSGAAAAGEQMMSAGLEFLQSLKAAIRQ